MQRGFLVRGLLVAVCLVSMVGLQAHAVWRVDIESKTVAKGQTGVQIAVKAYWDIDIVQMSLPVVVRQVSGGAFWTGVLPYWYSSSNNHGVTWNWSNPGWAALIQEVRTGIPTGACGTEGDVGYDAVPPDHWLMNVQASMDSTPAEPLGRNIFYLTFNVNNQAGEFEFDTACMSNSIDRLYWTDIYSDEHGLAAEINKGVITIPPGNQAVQIESQTVPTSSTGVQLGIKIANDDALQHLTLPFLCRNVSGGAFWTNMPASLDTLPWTGRLTSALVYSRTLNKSLVDGVSPDPFLIEAYKNADPALDPGPSQKMIPLVFDVNGNGGSFEIDTAFFPPDKGLKVETVGNPGLAITPGFAMGTVILVPPDTGNKVEISTISVQAKKKNVVLKIKISTAQRVKSISIPLRARSVSGGAFWAANFDTLTWWLIPPNALTTARQVVKQLNFDYNSPDDFLIWAKTDLGPCLDAGTHPAFLSIRFDVNNNPGVFEIDTALLPPMRTLYFGLCDEVKSIAPSFIKGVVIIEPCDCSRNGDVNCDGYQNPIDVVYMLNFVYKLGSWLPCNPGNCSQNGDLNCDGFYNPLDVVIFINWIYRQVGGPCDPCTMP